MIESTNNNKDRYSLLSKTILKDLRIYYKEWKPKDYLFEGVFGSKYSAESVVRLLEEQLRKQVLGIFKPY